MRQFSARCVLHGMIQDGRVHLTVLDVCQQRQPLLTAPAAHSAMSLALQCTVLPLCHAMAGAGATRIALGSAALSAVSWRQHPIWALRA
jgi:hypothetical protein